MNPATEFYAFVVGFLAALVAVMVALAAAHHYWTRRITPVPTERNDDEWAAITAAVDLELWEMEMES